MTLAVKLDVGKFKPSEVIGLTLSHKCLQLLRVL